MAKSTSLEIESPHGWRAIDVAEALKTNQRRGRCVGCHEPVRVHRASRNGMAAHVEHLRRNPACPLSDARVTDIGSGVSKLPPSGDGRRELSAGVSQQGPAQPSVTADDLARWRRQLLRLFDQLEQSRVPNAGAGARLTALRDAKRVPRIIFSFMKAVLETRNATEYDDQMLFHEDAVAVRGAWDAVCAWAKRRGLQV